MLLTEYTEAWSQGTERLSDSQRRSRDRELLMSPTLTIKEGVPQNSEDVGSARNPKVPFCPGMTLATVIRKKGRSVAEEGGPAN